MADNTIIENSKHENACNGSITDLEDSLKSSQYRLSGTPYGFVIHFKQENFSYWLEFTQMGIGVDTRFLRMQYPIAFVTPDDRDMFGRDAVKFLDSTLPIEIPRKTLEKAIARYVRTERFRSVCDSFKLTTPLAILSNGSIVFGVPALNIYNRGKLEYQGFKVLTSWIPYEMRPKELYKVSRDRRLTSAPNRVKQAKRISFQHC